MTGQPHLSVTMLDRKISFQATLPGTDLRWILRTHSGFWLPFEPPQDWWEGDYDRASQIPARAFGVPGPSDSVFLASTNVTTRVEVLVEGAVGDFANPCPTPAGILATAQRFGFLKYQPPITLLREEAFSITLRLGRCGPRF